MKQTHKRIIKSVIVFMLFLALLFPYLKDFIYASKAGDTDTPEGMHFIVRHWHSGQEEGVAEVAIDVEGYLQESCCYLKDENGDYVEKEIGYSLKDKDGNKIFEYDNSEEDPSVTIYAVPGENEEFTGFATAAGHAVVERTVGEGFDSVTITYDPNIHLVKVHAFYEKIGIGYNGSAELGDNETKIDDNGIKYYNTAVPGLHTDKTASVHDEDNRTFDLTLEAWNVDDFVADVGMVLDASGSMAFTSEDLEPIKVDSDIIGEYGMMTFLTSDQVNELLDKRLTDNSKLSYSGYSYFVYDPREDVKEYNPIGYWDGTAELISEEPIQVTEPEELGDEEDALIGYYDCSLTNNVIYNLAGNIEEITDRGHLAVAKSPAEDGLVSIAETTNPTAAANSNSGFRGIGKALDLARTFREKNSGKGAAVNVDAVPHTNSFTISFAVKGSSTKPVVWIGNKDQTESKAWYAIYVDTKAETPITKIISSQTGETPENGIDDITEEEGVIAELDSSGDSDGWYVCTYVFEYDEQQGTNITVYVNGLKLKEATVAGIQIEDSNDVAVILGGSAWESDFGGSNWEDENVQFLIDEMYLYDCPLDAEEVAQLYTYMTYTAEESDPIYAAVAPSLKDSAEKTTMARLNYANTDGAGAGAGWYYVSSGSDWELISNEKLLTSKTYIGIPDNEKIYNYINEMPEKISDEMSEDLKAGNTEDQYIVAKAGTTYPQFQSDGEAAEEMLANEENETWNGSILFYIDYQGYLRCLYNTGKAQKQNGSEVGPNAKWEENYSFCSYVFQKDDLTRIKTESLQRALGSFVTRLNEVSPASRVSAVRFSTKDMGGEEINNLLSKEDINDEKYKQADEEQNTNLDKLVLLDWTDNTRDSIGMLGLRRGNRTATSSAISKEDEGIEQYNYVLTGGTVTWTGLRAYRDYLAARLEGTVNTVSTENGGNTDGTGEVQEKKYLIIFTDGKDTSGEVGKGYAEYLATQLKSEGYTIFCVMMQSAGNKSEDSIEFLNLLASKPDYVYAESENVDELTAIFTTNILDTIMECLPGYSVRDYIDPRFDLVQDGEVIHLNENGSIVVGDEAITISNSEKGYEIVDNCGQKAYLYYDAENDMYYLEWQNQMIPGCCLYADTLDVGGRRSQLRQRRIS